jgi:Uma2 family endonuclease
MMTLNDLRTVHPGEVYPALMPLSLDFHSAPLSDEQFEELCRNNGDMKFELTGKGELIIATPTGPDSGWRNSELTTDVTLWARKDKTGVVFDSSTIFTFPNGAKRSPDVSWMTKDKWDSISREERRLHSRVVPDFVIELLSPTDSLIVTQEKMEEYIANGVRLGWLIDPQRKRVHVYRENGERQILDDPELVSGEDVLRGFELEVRRIW